LCKDSGNLFGIQLRVPAIYQYVELEAKMTSGTNRWMEVARTTSRSIN